MRASADNFIADALGYKIDCMVMLEYSYIIIPFDLRDQRTLYLTTCEVGGMDNPPGGVSAFTAQIETRRFG
jgi:hypothetical protein